MTSTERADMRLMDQSAEYYRLREGHERALALAAKSGAQRAEHLLAADRYAALARGNGEDARAGVR